MGHVHRDVEPFPQTHQDTQQADRVGPTGDAHHYRLFRQEESVPDNEAVHGFDEFMVLCLQRGPLQETNMTGAPTVYERVSAVSKLIAKRIQPTSDVLNWSTIKTNHCLRSISQLTPYCCESILPVEECYGAR